MIRLEGRSVSVSHYWQFMMVNLWYNLFVYFSGIEEVHQLKIKTLLRQYLKHLWERFEYFSTYCIDLVPHDLTYHSADVVTVGIGCDVAQLLSVIPSVNLDTSCGVTLILNPSCCLE